MGGKWWRKLFGLEATRENDHLAGGETRGRVERARAGVGADVGMGAEEVEITPSGKASGHGRHLFPLGGVDV
jgi:hypothetical protein